MAFSSGFVEMLKKNRNPENPVSPDNILQLYEQHLMELMENDVDYAWFAIPREIRHCITECLQLIASNLQLVGKTKSPKNDMSLVGIDTYAFYRTEYSQYGQCDITIICDISTATGIVIRFR